MCVQFIIRYRGCRCEHQGPLQRCAAGPYSPRCPGILNSVQVAAQAHCNGCTAGYTYVGRTLWPLRGQMGVEQLNPEYYQQIRRRNAILGLSMGQLYDADGNLVKSDDEESVKSEDVHKCEDDKFKDEDVKNEEMKDEEVKAEVKAEVKTEVKAEVKIEVSGQVNSEVKNENESNVGVEVQTEYELHVKEEVSGEDARVHADVANANLIQHPNHNGASPATLHLHQLDPNHHDDADMADDEMTGNFEANDNDSMEVDESESESEVSNFDHESDEDFTASDDSPQSDSDSGKDAARSTPRGRRGRRARIVMKNARALPVHPCEPLSRRPGS